MVTRERKPRWLGPAALFVFALSGCSGLIYQSIWSQYLGLYLGHAAYAQSLVLAIFMGGMAVGAWWASRRSHQWRNLLRNYALIELAIGIAAALFHPTYVGLTSFAYDTAFPGLPGNWAVQTFKWSSGALLILPQSILLGMTFPLMSSGLMRRLRSGDGAILGGLYFTNSIGAAFGALFATFVLLPAVGMPGAMRFGAALNVLVALAAFLLSRQSETLLPAQSSNSTTADRAGTTRLLLVAAFVTGATSFVYEIGWVRMLSLVFGSTVHTFELMLAAFIGGLAFGGLWIRRRIDGYAAPIRVGGWVQILMGLAALLSLALYDHAFDWVAWFLRALSHTESGYSLYNTVTAAVSLVLMAPAAFFAGMTLPLFTMSLMRAGGGEAAVGRVYAANTVGAIVGVFAAVHLLIPVIGMKLAMITAAAGDLALGLALLRREGSATRAADNPYLGALVLCGAALAATMLLARFDPAAMAGGVYRTSVARFSVTDGKQVLYYRDGKTASVAVLATVNQIRAIATNGKIDAAIRMADDGKPAMDEITMAMAAAVPLLHHPHPRTAAVIGFGSGMSTHTMLGDPRLERVDTIEIEPAMIEGARAFGKHVERAYSDPRSHIHIEDARTYFAANRSRYDIILSEPSNPWVSGVASLFSREFYAFIPHHLAPGGLYVQWVQLYEINDELVASIANALSQNFSDYRIYLTYNSDMLIVARADGLVEDLHAEALEAPNLKASLQRLDIATVPEILAHQLGDRRSMQTLFGAFSDRSNSDYYPILSLQAPRARFSQQMAQGIANLASTDLPYREVLGGLMPPRVQDITDSPSFAYTGASHRAQRLAEALRSGAALTGADDIALAYLRDAVGECRNVGDPAIVLSSLVDMASHTVPYLDPVALHGAWIEPAWIHCTAQPPSVHATLDVIAALARRDGKALQAQATALLAADDAISAPGLREWLLRAAMLGAIEAGDYVAVEQLEQSAGRTITSTPPDVWYRTWMRNVARQRIAESTPVSIH